MEVAADVFSWLSVIFLIGFANCDSYTVPPVTLTAYTPSGLKASIPDSPTLSQFVFHARINDDINQLDTGSIFGEAGTPTHGKRTYFNPDVKLKVGDTVAYWVFVQNNYLGYRQEGKKWTVTKLENVPLCTPSITALNGDVFDEPPCQNVVIFEDNFDNINEDAWLKNKYIPYYDMDYEFVSYEKLDTVLFTKDGKLFIKPTERSSVYGNLNLVEGCTREYPLECDMDSEGQFILPPIISAKLTSKFKFKFGKIEIKAKLPAGDWIYPQLHLHSDTPESRIIIAYARGNDRLLDNAGTDYGGRLLFGGPAFSYTEPERSQYLRSTRSSTDPFTSSEHTFTMVWAEDSLQLYVDDERYGEVMNHQFKNEASLVIGVGVGGVNDFPDNFTSGDYRKPWMNSDPKQNTDFYLARNNWNKTWVGDETALQVNSVKIWAL